MKDDVTEAIPRQDDMRGHWFVDDMQGHWLVAFVGPASLRPGVGQLVLRTGQRQYCGAMEGIATAINKHPNVRDPSRASARFVGECIAIAHTGQVLLAREFYLPDTLTRTIETNLTLSGAGVPFSVEIWCKSQPRSRRGYSYVTYNHRKHRGPALRSNRREGGGVRSAPLPQETR